MTERPLISTKWWKPPILEIWGLNFYSYSSIHHTGNRSQLKLYNETKYRLLIFLSSIESRSLRRMGPPGPGPWWRLNQVLSDHSMNGRYLVWDHDIDPTLPWVDSTHCWVTILLNGRHLVRDHDVDRSSTGRLSLVLIAILWENEDTVSPRLGSGMCVALWPLIYGLGVLLQGLATLG